MTDQDPSPSLVFHPSARRVVRFGAFRMDLSDGSLWRDGQEVRLPPRALVVLQHLVERAGRIVSKQALMDAAWKDAHVSETSLTEAIGVIRQTLGDDPQQPQFIQTVHRRGYRFVAPIAVDAAAGGVVSVVPAQEPIGPTAVGGVARRRRVARWIAAGIFVALVATLVTIAGIAPWRQARPRVTRASITLPPDQAPAPGLNAHPVVALSPDGKRIVYVAGSTGSYQLYVRQMDQFEATPIPGTKGGHGPFFAPDGRWVAYFQHGALRKVSLDGGEPITLAPAAGGFGGVWLADGSIVFAPDANSGLLRVASSGGATTALPRPSAACGYRWPSAAGDGDTIIATRWRSIARDAAVVALSIRSGRERVVAERGTFGRYVPTGQVVYIREGELLAAPLDAAAPQGVAHLLSGVMTGVTGAGQFGFSEDGTLLYLPESAERTRRMLGRVNAAGRLTDLPTPGRPYQNLAACGDRFATTINEKGLSDIWVGHVDRPALTRLTFDGANVEPAWTPDCRAVTFASSRSGLMSVYVQPVETDEPPKLVLTGKRARAPGSWSADGRRLAFVEIGGPTRGDVLLFETTTGAIRPQAVTAANESWPRLDPLGRLVAYTSDESGKSEIYLRSLDNGRRLQVSADGGVMPAWSSDGAALYYQDDGAIFRVRLDRSGSPALGAPERVFAHPDLVVFRPLSEGFIVVRRTAEHLPLTKLNLVVNWFEELGRK